VIAVALAATACLGAVSSAGATTRYRTCLHTRHEVIKAKHGISCSHARRLAHAGRSVDGDDGAHFRLFGRRWQCVTIGRPDRGRHALLGCFTPSAPMSPRRFRDSAVVMVLIYVRAD
jgi:hypothetical protein